MSQKVEITFTDGQIAAMAPMFQIIHDSIPPGRLRRTEPKYAVLGTAMIETGRATFYLCDIEAGREIQSALDRMRARKLAQGENPDD